MQHYLLNIVITAPLLSVLFLAPLHASLNTTPDTTPEIALARQLCKVAQRGHFEQIPAMLNNYQLSQNATNIKSNSQALLTAIKQDSVPWVKALLCCGIINLQDINNNTALHVAISHKHLSVAELLLSSGANVNLQDNEGNTPLHLAVASNDIELVKLLLIHQANLDIPNALGVTPLQWVCDLNYQNSDITRLLMLIKQYFK